MHPLESSYHMRSLQPSYVEPRYVEPGEVLTQKSELGLGLGLGDWHPMTVPCPMRAHALQV